jgi:toxin-antitoxin system PIN domain toxin
VIIPDVNLLLYAEIDASPFHERARVWWENVLSDEHPVGLATACVFGFLRIATNRRVFSEPLAVDDAAARVEGWLARPHVTMLVPGPEHFTVALRLLRQLGTGGNLTTDVQIAAHALDTRGQVFSNDGDFGRFEGVRWTNPLRA